MLAKPRVLAVPVGERFSGWVTHCPWAFIVRIEDGFRVTKQCVSIENMLPVSVFSKTPNHVRLRPGKWAGVFNFTSVSVCQHGRGGGIKTRLSLSRDAFVTPTLLNQPAWIECMYTVESRRKRMGLCSL